MEFDIHSLSDVDLDIAECLQNCPELDAPLLDASVLDQLCLSEELWAELPDANTNLCEKESVLEVYDVQLPPSPPQSPPDPTTPTPSFTVTNPPPEGIMTSVQLQNSMVVQESAVTAAAGSLPNGVQVLKSGEVVYVQLPQQPATFGRNSGSGENFKVTHVSMSVKQESSIAGQKRPHPDSPPADSSKLSRKQQRMIKNRESASNSRQKKKEYVSTLEVRLREAALKNAALLRENVVLRKQVSTLEDENNSLRASASNPSSPLTSLRTPAIMLAVVFCFAIFFVPQHMIISPLAVPNPNTALTLPTTSHAPGRALLSYEPPQATQLTEPHSKEKALVAVSTTALSTLNQYVEKAMKGWRTDRRDSVLMGVHAPTVCSCPSHGSGRNATNSQRLSEDMTQCFKWCEDHFPLWQPSSQEPRSSLNSLAVFSNSDTPPSSTLLQSYDITRLYHRFKKSFVRDLDNYYLISFKDHLLLNAPLHNSSEPPLLSVIIPAEGGFYSSPDGFLPLLQFDCEVLDAKVVHLELPKSAL